MIYPQEVARLRDRNISYRGVTSTVKNSHQDGDFKLEERIQAMKRMAPKGMVTKETWTRISRSLDDVDLAVRHGMRLLNYFDGDSRQFTNIINEIVAWRAYLRNSQYLKQDCDRPMTMSGKILSPEMNNLREVLHKKRQLYFEMATSTNLENIRYDNVELTSDMIMEEIIYGGMNDLDSDE